MSAMRVFMKLIMASLAVTAAAIVAAAPLSAAEPSPQAEVAALTTPKERVDALFADLKKEGDEGKARQVADRIRLEWQDSGSATVNLLMQWANKAIADEKHRRHSIFWTRRLPCPPTMSKAGTAAPWLAGRRCGC